jgi:hypothetical protein
MKKKYNIARAATWGAAIGFTYDGVIAYSQLADSTGFWFHHPLRDAHAMGMAAGGMIGGALIACLGCVILNWMARPKAA